MRFWLDQTHRGTEREGAAVSADAKTSTASDVAEFELNDLRRAIETLPDNHRAKFARLAILILLLDMAPKDRRVTLAMLLTTYFPFDRT